MCTKMEGKPKFMIAGHSFIRRLALFLPPRQFLGGSCDVVWKYQGGSEISDRRSYMSTIDEELAKHEDVQCVFLQLGNNDIELYHQLPALTQLVQDYVRQVRELCIKHDVRAVVCSEIPRNISGSLRKTAIFNFTLESMVSSEDHITYWHHKGLHKGNSSVLLPDRVHLNGKGQTKYFYSLQRALAQEKLRSR